MYSYADAMNAVMRAVSMNGVAESIIAEMTRAVARLILPAMISALCAIRAVTLPGFVIHRSETGGMRDAKSATGIEIDNAVPVLTDSSLMCRPYPDEGLSTVVLDMFRRDGHRVIPLSRHRADSH
jgi:hypothetical protein